MCSTRTVSEVYDRLWVAHEADVGIDAALQIRGLFDMYRWSVEKFELISAVKTSEGTCSVEKDRVVIENLINQRGGYDRLDGAIMVFRKKMLGELTDFLHLVGGEGRGALGDLGLCRMNTAVRHCH